MLIYIFNIASIKKYNILFCILQYKHYICIKFNLKKLTYEKIILFRSHFCGSNNHNGNKFIVLQQNRIL